MGWRLEFQIKTALFVPVFVCVVISETITTGPQIALNLKRHCCEKLDVDCVVGM